MYCMFAQIIEAGKILRWNVQEGHRGILLHLFIATLHCIRPTLSSIFERDRIIETRVIWSLADSEQNTNALLMIALDCFLQHASLEITPTTAWITQTYPMDTWIRGLW